MFAIVQNTTKWKNWNKMKIQNEISQHYQITSRVNLFMLCKACNIKGIYDLQWMLKAKGSIVFVDAIFVMNLHSYISRFMYCIFSTNSKSSYPWVSSDSSMKKNVFSCNNSTWVLNIKEFCWIVWNHRSAVCIDTIPWTIGSKAD